MTTETKEPQEPSAPLTLEGIDAHYFLCEHCHSSTALFILSGGDKFNCQSCGQQSAMNNPVNAKDYSVGGLPFMFRQPMSLSQETVRALSGNDTAERQPPDTFSTFSISVLNRDSFPHDVALFGANERVLSANFGLPSSVTLAMEGRTYAQILFESQQRPFVVSGFRFSSNHPAQLNEFVSVIKKNPISGAMSSMPISLLEHHHHFQLQQNVIDVLGFEIPVDGNTELSFRLLPSASVQFTFFIARRNSGNTINNPFD